MIWGILLAAIVLMGIAVYHWDHANTQSYCDCDAGAVVFAIGSLFLGSLIGSAIASNFAGEEVKTRQELVALADTTGLEGSVFLLSGSIGEGHVYTYYYKDGAGLRNGRLEDEYGNMDILVIEDGRREYISYGSDQSPWINLFDNAQRWEFHVPAGSVTNKIQLDLEG